MSQILRTHSPVEPDADDDPDSLDSGIAVSPSDVVDRLWRFFISKRVGLVLILAMGLLSLVGTVLAQAPAGMRDDPQAYPQWLALQRGKYGGWTTVLDTLGLFAVFSSIWFKAVTVLLTTSILACSINRAPRLWRQAIHPRTRMGDAFFSHAALRARITVPVGTDGAIAAAQRALRSHRFRTLVDPDGSPGALYADRHRFGPFGTVVAHVSFVGILLGAAISGSAGFKDTQFAVPVGSRVEVGHGTGIAVEARSFSDSYYPDGSPRDYASELVLHQNGHPVATKTVRVNQPMRWGGLSLYQSFFGVAAAIQVEDGAGKVVFDSGVPLAWSSDDGTHSIGQFELPAQRLRVYVVAAASGEVDPNIQPGQMQLEIYAAGADTPMTTTVVSQGKPTAAAGLSFTFARERQFTGLIVAHDPGAIFVWVGSILMVLGLFLVLFFPHRRVWVSARETTGGSEIRLASAMRRDSAFEAQFHRLVGDIQRSGTRPPEPIDSSAEGRAE